VAELDAVLGERRAEVARVKSGLDAFGIDLNLKSRFRK
jgi:hypothetical protein